MIIDVRGLPHQSWLMFFLHVKEKYIECENEMMPENLYYEWSGTPYRIQVKTVEPENLYYEWSGTPYRIQVKTVDDQSVAHTQRYKIIGRLIRRHDILPFDIRFHLEIDPNQKDAGHWHSSTGNKDAFRILNIFTEGAKEGVLIRYHNFLVPFRKLEEFLKGLDETLTRLAVHPGREEFWERWKRFFGQMNLLSSSDYPQELFQADWDFLHNIEPTMDWSDGS